MYLSSSSSLYILYDLQSLRKISIYCMMMTTTRALMLLVALMVGLGADVDGADNVTYDGRSLIVDGHRKILFSGSIHYPRSTPQMWGSLIAKAKEGGLDVIETYVFWNTHQPLPGQYNFNGRRDIVRFIKEVQAQGLYAVLRIGPFVQAEWSYGGLPFWLHDIPGIAFRSDNEPFKAYMQNFTTKIVSMMQSEKLYASQGGPIILSQIENEYGTIEKAYGTAGKAYVQWAAQMAVGLQTGVPWVMCKQDDAPDPVINTCNGLRCGETFKGPNSPNKPAIWTENWTTHYQLFGEDAPLRSAEDIAFHVTLFILAKNGTFVNYYMYHGGTNFGRQGSEFATTSYYDQAPIDEYGLINQPKWGHLKEMHAAVKLCLTPILSGVQQIVSLGTYGQAFVYTVPSGECAAFLVNNDTKDGSVFFQNSSYDLPAKSISILPDCKNVVFNTAKVSTQYNTRTMLQGFVLDGANMWQEFKESIPNFDDTSMRSQTLMEQMNTTKDASDYLWYNFRLEEESSNAQATLNVSSLGHVLHAFVNGQLVGSAQGSHANPRFNLESTISLNQGLNNISLLSVMVGLPDSGGHMERKAAGLSSVSIGGEKGNQHFLNYSWGYQVGLVGENLQIYLGQRSNRVQWSNFSNAGNPLTWYKTIVDAPPTDLPVALNLGSMGKGEAWVNGLSIGRYWPSYHTPNGSSQIWYHIPRAYLKPTGNLLVVMEEQGGNPLKISLDTAAITQTCSHMTTSFLPSVSQWLTTSDNQTRIANGRRAARAHLACPSTTKISQVLFASYGTPAGSCSTTYAFGSCHSLNSKSIVQKVCLGKRRCSIPVSNQSFGGDPCAGNSKSLLVAVECK